MCNRNNEFILIIYIARRKMADVERRELEIGLDFGCSSFVKRNNYSEVSFEPKKYAQVIRVRGGGGGSLTSFLAQITCWSPFGPLCTW